MAGVTGLMFAIDGTVVAVALPTMMADLHAPLVLLGWVLTAYLLTQTTVMPVVGKLSESVGRRPCT